MPALVDSPSETLGAVQPGARDALQPGARGALSSRRQLAFLLIVGSTVLGIAGTDLVLPAVPTLPAALGGDLERAQLVLASFVAGAACGLLAFGELGARFDQRRLLLASLLSYGALSLCAALSSSLTVLIALRFLQGAAGAAAAVFAPGMIRSLYGDAQAVSMLGRLGSIEGLTPALAPVAGAWLLRDFGWNASFVVIAGLAGLLAVAVALSGQLLPALVSQRARGGYGALLRDRCFLRYALSQAFTLGGLLVFVFGCPAVFVSSLGAPLSHFIGMQITGIFTFIVAATLTGRLSRVYGAERMIGWGTALSALGAGGLLVHALCGGTSTLAVAALFVPFNLGLGLRGPPGFHCAVLAAQGDDARGAAVVVVAVLASTAVGTAVAAPFIGLGLVPIALVACVWCCAALGLLRLLPALRQPA